MKLNEMKSVSIGSTISAVFHSFKLYGKYSHGQLIYPAKSQPKIPSAALII